MDKHLKKVETAAKESVCEAIEEFDRMDPRRFKRSVQIGEFENTC